MEIKPYLPLFTLCLLFASCKQKPDDPVSWAPGQTAKNAPTAAHQQEQRFLITAPGDTILIGIPISPLKKACPSKPSGLFLRIAGVFSGLDQKRTVCAAMIYDGVNFTHYTTKEVLDGNWVSSILEDRNGYLWFGTNGGVSHYDPYDHNGQGSFTHFTTKEGLIEAAVKRTVAMEEIGNGIWRMYYRHVFLGYFDEKLIHSKEQYLKLTNKIV